MAITFLQTQKRQRLLVLILALVTLLIVLFVWQRLRPAEEIIPSAPAVSLPQVKINWQTLDNPQLQALLLFEQIPSFEGKVGRENPFLPY